MKTFDDVVNGKLEVSIHGFVQGEKKESATLVGLHAVRDWLNAHGGYASIKANYGEVNGRGIQITGWSIYRVYEGYGHRCCGNITEAKTAIA